MEQLAGQGVDDPLPEVAALPDNIEHECHIPKFLILGCA
jgi:hypothetical protein